MKNREQITVTVLEKVKKPRHVDSPGRVSHSKRDLR
jgi:hypothetical protein